MPRAFAYILAAVVLVWSCTMAVHTTRADENFYKIEVALIGGPNHGQVLTFNSGPNSPVPATFSSKEACQEFIDSGGDDRWKAAMADLVNIKEKSHIESVSISCVPASALDKKA